MSLAQEDPLSFLSDIRESCPDILSILTTDQVRLLSRHPLDPYSPEQVDKEYLTDAWHHQSIRLLWKKGVLNLKKYLLKPRDSTKPFSHQDLENYERKNDNLEKVLRRAELITESRLRATEDKHGYCCLPRIVRICKKFNFSKNEARIATYSLVCQFSKQHKSKHRRQLALSHLHEEKETNNPITVSQFLDIPILEVLRFLQKERQHMQKELFAIFGNDVTLQFEIVYDKDYCRILMGSKVAADEFLKLQQNFLADIVSEEPGNEHLSMRKSTAKETDSKKSEKIEEDMGATSHNTLDLDAILDLERAKEKVREDHAIDIKKDELKREADGALKPYKRDLEYLNDHFDLIVHKFKVYHANLRAEIVKGLEGCPSKMVYEYQQKLKDAKAAEQGQQKMCEKRLALTRAAGSWYPRLESMVESRNLDLFEKNILMSLICATVHPHKRDQTSNYISKKTSINAFMEQFCLSMEEKIHHVKYFHKNAPLVREGMVIVQSKGLTGDFSTAI